MRIFNAIHYNYAAKIMVATPYLNQYMSNFFELRNSISTYKLNLNNEFIWNNLNYLVICTYCHFAHILNDQLKAYLSFQALLLFQPNSLVFHMGGKL